MFKLVLLYKEDIKAVPSKLPKRLKWLNYLINTVIAQ